MYKFWYKVITEDNRTIEDCSYANNKRELVEDLECLYPNGFIVVY